MIGKRAGISLVLLACIVGVVAMSKSAEPEHVRVAPLPVASARVDGRLVSVNVPLDMVANPTVSGFVLRLKDAMDRRVAPEIEVTLLAGSPPDHAIETRELGEDKVTYRTETGPGGSAGESFVLTAWKRCAAGTIRMRLNTQNDGGDAPGLDDAWAVIASATCS